MDTDINSTIAELEAAETTFADGQIAARQGLDDGANPFWCSGEPISEQPRAALEWNDGWSLERCAAVIREDAAMHIKRSDWAEAA